MTAGSNRYPPTKPSPGHARARWPSPPPGLRTPRHPGTPPGQPPPPKGDPRRAPAWPSNPWPPRTDTLRSLTRERMGILIAAAVFPLLVSMALGWHHHRLDTLAETGRPIEIQVHHAGPEHNTQYHFHLDGQRHDGSVGRSRAPLEVGDRREGRYLPSNPDLNRPYGPAAIRLEVAKERDMARLIVGVIAWILLATALVTHWRIQQLHAEAVGALLPAQRRRQRWLTPALSLAPILTPVAVLLITMHFEFSLVTAGLSLGLLLAAAAAWVFRSQLAAGLRSLSPQRLRGWGLWLLLVALTIILRAIFD